jgi:hypothetical protein
MPSIRIGFSTDFNVTSEQVGIGTTLPTARLDVRGQILADNSAGGGGISTLTRYDGFLNKTQSLPNNVSIAQTTKGNLNSLSGEIVIDGEITVEEGTALTGGRLDSLTVTGTFDIPHGGSEDREETPEKGSTRFNQDLGQLEFYTGLEWRTTASYDGSGRGRGVFGGGDTPTRINAIDYINISSTGNASDFGDLTTIRTDGASGVSASSIRGIFGAGTTPGSSNVIDYITIASEGNAIDFGDSTQTTGSTGACSSSTRAVFGGGGTNTIDYIEISTLGDAIDFGDLSAAKSVFSACSSSTRGVFGGGVVTPVFVSTIDSVTISSKGNAVKFGDLTHSIRAVASCSSSTRGLFAGGNTSPGVYPSSIDFITISSTGNAVIFGDLTVEFWFAGSCSSNIRGVFGGGTNGGSGITNIINYVTIATQGNAQDFGELSQARNAPQGCSDSHGGLGGF